VQLYTLLGTRFKSEYQLDDEDGIERLFFELASESRLSILLEINRQKGKMREIARKLNLSTTDTFRQLQRLSDAMLIEKQNDGSYGITQYGILVLKSANNLNFLFKHKVFFSSHNFACLPSQFLDRIGELSKAEFSSDTMASINVVQRIIREADQYMWTGAVEQPLSIRHILVESIPRGVKYKFLFPKQFITADLTFPGMECAVEWRAIVHIPVNFVVSEKEAGISFCLPSGKTDYVGFFGKDPTFMNWVKELFQYYWAKGIRV
jgi:predicted transcriptional regulator